MRISEQESYRMTDAVQRSGNKNPNASGAGSSQAEEDTMVYNFEDQELEEEKMISVWKAFAEVIKQREEQSLFVTLTSETPRLKETTIQFDVANQYQKEFIENIKLEFLRFLRTELQNKTILIELIIKASDHKFKKNLTPKEMYEQMVEKNPVLHELRVKLDLDIRH